MALNSPHESEAFDGEKSKIHSIAERTIDTSSESSENEELDLDNVKSRLSKVGSFAEKRTSGVH